MTWVYFEDGDRQTAAPAFSLERSGGGRVSLNDFYEESCLVLLFPQDAPGALGAVERFGGRLDEIERQGAQIVALIRDTGGKASLPFDAASLSFPLLSDPGGRVWAEYAGLMVPELVPEGSALLYVLDVYGAPWAAYIGESLDEDGLLDEVLSWLVFIGVQCPE
jgi:peroxiredoxin